MKTIPYLLCVGLIVCGPIQAQTSTVTFKMKASSEKVKEVQFSKYDYASETMIELQSLPDIKTMQDYYFEDQLAEPSLYTVSLNSGEVSRMAVEQGGLVELQLGEEILIESKVAAKSDFGQIIQELNARYFADMIDEYDKAIKEKDQATIERLEKKKNALLVDFIKAMEDEVRQMGASALAYDALAYFDLHKNYSFLQEMERLFQSELPNSGLTKSLQTRMAKADQVALGNEAPFFTAMGAHGAEVKLSDFNGTYLLIDFWASWCRACRVENPRFVDLRQAYADKGFDIISISIDSDSTQWKKAVEKDALNWTQVLDTDHSIYNQYLLSSLPSNFLLNREGVIVAKNFNGDQLKSLLKKFLND